MVPRAYQYQSRLPELVISALRVSLICLRGFPMQACWFSASLAAGLPQADIRGTSLWSPPSQARHVKFCQVLGGPDSLDEHARKFLTAFAPTGRPESAPALVQQGLQPIMLKRQRLNPSRPCQEFRQGLSRISPSPGRSGRVRAGPRVATLPRPR